jgi:hypothetical protein
VLICRFGPPTRVALTLMSRRRSSERLRNRAPKQPLWLSVEMTLLIAIFMVVPAYEVTLTEHHAPA